MLDPVSWFAGIYTAHKIAIAVTGWVTLGTSTFYGVYKADQSDVTDMHAISVYDPRYIEFMNSIRIAEPV